MAFRDSSTPCNGKFLHPSACRALPRTQLKLIERTCSKPAQPGGCSRATRGQDRGPTSTDLHRPGGPLRSFIKAIPVPVGTGSDHGSDAGLEVLSVAPSLLAHVCRAVGGTTHVSSRHTRYRRTITLMPCQIAHPRSYFESIGVIDRSEIQDANRVEHHDPC